jgi:hypothetical protein
LKHLATADFWACYEKLPAAIRSLADKNFALLKGDPAHPSLQFKKIGSLRSVRVGIAYRALGVEIEGGVLWYWIGSHADYDKLIG